MCYACDIIDDDFLPHSKFDDKLSNIILQFSQSELAWLINLHFVNSFAVHIISTRDCKCILISINEEINISNQTLLPIPIKTHASFSLNRNNIINLTMLLIASS